MERVTEHLYRSAPERPFGNEVETCAYLLRRDDGNLLIYSSGELRRDEAQLRDLGGVERQYLNHRDEAAAGCDWVARTLEAPLHCHEQEREAVAEHCTVHHTFDREHQAYPDLEVIPTPGHCPGSTCYLWRAPDRRYLFTGDTVYLANGDWRVYVSRGTALEMIASLERIAALDFEVLVPGLFIGEAKHMATTAAETKRRVGEIIARLRQGEIH